ncbi:MAG: type IV pilin N-terminal domain-containing protein [Methermicoccaceae archaeon]
MADERAVSSVLGEMLMLSITVVLASVVIVSMNSLAPLQHTPHVDIKVEYNGSLVLWHVGGEAMSTQGLLIRIFNASTTEGYTTTLNSTAFDPQSDVGSRMWMFGERIIINESTLNSTPPFEVIVLHDNHLLTKQEVYE